MRNGYLFVVPHCCHHSVAISDGVHRMAELILVKFAASLQVILVSVYFAIVVPSML